MPAIDLDTIRAQFPALAGTDEGKARIFFDNPAGTQVPSRVVDAMRDCLVDACANLGGYFPTSERATKIAEDAHQAMADFLNAPSADEIVFGQNMTSIAFHLARSLGRRFREGDEIIVSRMDHDANVQPWVLMARDHGLEVRWLPFDTATYEFDLAELERLLGPRTRLVCIGGASNLTGTINDIDTICRMTRDAGAWSFIDAVQSAPHVPTDVQRTGCDFLVSSAYKFFGPHQGVLWGRREILEALEPYKVRPAPAELPWSFEPGTQSHEGMAGTAAAVDYFEWVGRELAVPEEQRSRTGYIHAAFDYLFAHELELTKRLLDGLEALPGTTIHGITDRDALDRRVSTVSFTSERRSPDDIARALADRNIFAWSGHNYALGVVESLGLVESGGTVRIGAVHYNSAEEIDQLLDALEAIL
jgi:cysteine desulfurase family protein (TIGR01976 family)